MECLAEKYEKLYEKYKRVFKKKSILEDQKTKIENELNYIELEYASFNREDAIVIDRKIQEYKSEATRKVTQALDPEINSATQNIQDLKSKEMSYAAQMTAIDGDAESKIREFVIVNRDSLEDYLNKVGGWLGMRTVNKVIDKKEFDQISLSELTSKKLACLPLVFARKGQNKAITILGMLLWPPFNRIMKKSSTLFNIIYLVVLVTLVGIFVPGIAAMVFVGGVLFAIYQYVGSFISLKQNADVLKVLYYSKDYLDYVSKNSFQSRKEETMASYRTQRKSYESRLIQLLNIKEAQLKKIEETDYSEIKAAAIAQLEAEYKKLGEAVQNKRYEKNKTEMEIANAQKELVSIHEKINEIGLEEPVEDRMHNEGVITPTFMVSLGDEELPGGPKTIHLLRHNYKPTLILYNREVKEDNRNEFSERATSLIIKFITGILVDNHYSHVQMSLVDFETGGARFPAQQTSGILSIYKNDNEMAKLIQKLEATRDNVNGQGDGKINNVNPTRVENRNTPIPYNVVFFYGYDMNMFDRELMQLYKTGEMFGFLPFIFLPIDLYLQIKEKNYERVSPAFAEAISIVPDENCYWFEFAQSELQQYSKIRNNTVIGLSGRGKTGKRI